MVPKSQNAAHSTLWSSDFWSNSGHRHMAAVQRMRHTSAPPPPAQLCSKHLKTSQSLACCLLHQRVSGNLSESSLRYSRRPSSASMQITSVHWQLLCCYLLWYSMSSSFRNLREPRPESIYITGSWKCHIGIYISQSQPMIHHLKQIPSPFHDLIIYFSKFQGWSILFLKQFCKPLATFKATLLTMR